MEVRLLGPVEVVVAGTPVGMGGPLQRAVLAALAVDVGRPVPADTLIQRVWGDSPDGDVRHMLHVYLSRIRKAFRDARASASIDRQPRCYLLDVEPDHVDLHRFRRLIAQARLREALDLWRGTPLADVPGDWAALVRVGWEQQRLDAAMAWAEHADDPTAVLAEIAADHPLAEGVVAALMLALHRAGRSAEALEWFTVTRRKLVAELGVEPGHRLAAAQAVVLAGDPVAVPAAEVPAPDPQAPVHLPVPLRGFTGRGVELSELDGVPIADGVGIAVVSGAAGVGKTALAVHWAHRNGHRFPDGRLHLDLRGWAPHESPMGVAEAVRTVLDAFGVAPERLSPDLSAQLRLYRTVLANRRVLLVLDNARDAAQVRPLLLPGLGSAVLVTSRDRLMGLVAAEGAVPVPLSPLDERAAHDLVVRRIGATRSAAEPDATRDIVARCAGLPLALGIAAAHAASHPAWPLAKVADELRDAWQGLTGLADGDHETDVRAVFSCSYRQLEPAQARLFRLLGVYPGRGISPPAAAALIGEPIGLTRQLLAALTRVHMATETDHGRFVQHDLLRAYANELAGDQTEAVLRLVDYYVHSAVAAEQVLDPSRVPEPLPAPLVTPETFDTGEEALRWFVDEHTGLAAAFELAAARDLHTQVWMLSWSTTTYYKRLGHWHEWLATKRMALDAATALGDRTKLAMAHLGIARVHAVMGDHDESTAHLTEALALADDDIAKANAHLGLGWLCERRGDHHEALERAEHALSHYRRAGDRGGEAFALNNIGSHQSRLGRYREAIASCRQALTLHQESGDRHGQADTWDSLGYAHLALADHEAAITCYRNAAQLFAALTDRHAEADVLIHLGDALQAGGNDAVECWERALRILTELDHPDAEEVKLRLKA